MVLAAIEAGVRAIHCEKPMAPTWAQARTMAEAVQRAGTAIIYTHQRRFESQFRAARRLVRSGAIGELLQIEGTCPNLFDWGTHWLDMFHFYNDESPARWVMGQADVGRAPKTFGVPIEEQGMAWIAYANGVQAVLLTGRDRRWPEMNRLIGTKGVIEVQMVGPDGKGIPVRIRGEGDVDWRIPEIVAEDHPGPGGSVAAATRDLLHCLETGGEPELSGARAFRATELIFAIYESSRRGARVDLPLDVQDVSLADLARQRGVEV